MNQPTVVPALALDRYFAHLRTQPRSERPWYVREALIAAAHGHLHPIPARGSSQIYMMRYWISPPEAKADEDRWESADSLMLHHILLPDDTAALHDHPWSFDTTILSGGYVEYLPPDAWLGRPDQAGPPTDTNQVLRLLDSSVHHEAGDLHAVGQVFPNTWTLVRTGEGGRQWGFHGPGQPWIDSATYLGRHPVADHALARQGAA